MCIRDSNSSAKQCCANPNPHPNGDAVNMDLLMQQMEGNLLDKLKSHTDKVVSRMEKQQRESEKKLINSLQTNLAAAVKAELQTQVKAVVIPACTQGVETVVARVLHQVVDQQLKAQLPKAVSKGLDSAVAAGLAGPAVADAFKQCFAQQLIPSFENSVQTMFKQINHAFQKGLQEQVAKPLQGQFDSMRNDLVTTITDSSNALSQAVLQIPTGSNSTTPVAATLTPKEQVSLLLEKGQVVDALSLALGQGDMECLMHACRNGSIAPLNEKPCRVPQKVLASLIQQLSCDLETDLEVKMEWLQAALLVLDQQDPLMQAMLPSLLQDLTLSLEESFARADQRGDSSKNSLKLMLHLVGSVF
eukprot:TRINITY_DN5464_c0_g1_i1.p1 TRINITY_DN5464_c0_g1~~TRINITY_DN5464_c0_g1_i1.p1  ORF type:complete len:360 (+),score=108.75 TRINITY_DN5464_c0_g1_i1:131-1210(+)